ncbi:MAG: phage tail assembly chaperone [Pseudomonadota bacterium]
MAFGLGVLRLSPAEFWAMTLPELKAAAGMGGRTGTHAPTADSLERLMARFPDAPPHTHRSCE